MEGILVLLLIFPGAFAFITCMALVDVKKALRAHRWGPLDGPTFDVLKRKKGDKFMSEDKAKTNTAACCSKRAAGITREAGWFGSALVAKFEEKFLQDGNDLLGFSGGEDDGVVLSLRDYDVSFFVDFDFCPVAWGDGVGGHAYTVSFKVRGGKVISYEVRGRGKYEVFVKILPQGQDVKNS